MSDTTERDAVLARFGANGWGYPYTERMADRIVELESAIERVRALHDGERRHVGWIDVICCRECSDDDNTYAYPCPTLRALEGTP